MEDEELLEKVKAFADQAHGSQMRRYTSDRYIVHPVRVMETVKDYITDPSVLAAALLHDVLEDTDVSEDELNEFLHGLMLPDVAEKTFSLVKELTDVYIKADYPTMNRRSRRSHEAGRLSETSPDAQTIKYSDIMDNATDISANDPDFALVYLRESKQLLLQLNKGNALLYQRTLQLVDECLKRFFKNSNIRSL